MAKKSAKRRPRRAPKMYPKGAPTSSSVKSRSPVEKAKKPASGKTEKETMSAEELREEYWYVYNDLKRIAAISGVLFGILIILTFVL